MDDKRQSLIDKLKELVRMTYGHPPIERLVNDIIHDIRTMPVQDITWKESVERRELDYLAVDVSHMPNGNPDVENYLVMKLARVDLHQNALESLNRRVTALEEQFGSFGVLR